jgi:hypothetical protein
MKLSFPMNADTVATYNRLEDAELLKNRLEDAGIRSVIHDESKLQRFWFLAKPDAAIKVQVPGENFDLARNLIKEWDNNDGVLRNAVRCPQCRSSRIEYPQYTRKFVTPILVEVFGSLGLFSKKFYCQDCQYTWPKTIEREPDTDALGWPVNEGDSLSKPSKRARGQTKANGTTSIR